MWQCVFGCVFLVIWRFIVYLIYLTLNQMKINGFMWVGSFFLISTSFYLLIKKQTKQDYYLYNLWITFKNQLNHTHDLNNKNQVDKVDNR